MNGPERFHCCATCQHFRVEKQPDGVTYRCSRLSYQTRPEWRFNCWSPREQVKQLMEKEERSTSASPPPDH